METIILPTITLPGGKIITLNSQQAEALDKMKAWSTQKDDLFFTLSGYAGTGKTTITKEFLDSLYKKEKHYRVCCSAPTHKAKKVIARATKEDSYTIQKLLGLRPNTDLENYDINDPQFDPLSDKEIRNYKLVVIDEGSMLNDSLFTLLTIEAKKFKTKLLFMGDEAQLPPINKPKDGEEEKPNPISKIFTDVASCYQLTKVERQKDGNPLMNIYDAIRSDIKSPVDLFEHKTRLNENGEGVEFFSNLIEFQSVVLPYFKSEEYRKDPDYIKLICYMNDSVKAWNNSIRQYIFDSPTVPLLVGEILMAYNTVIINRTELLLENSSDYKVESVASGVSGSGVPIWEVVIESIDGGQRSEINIVKEEGISKFLTTFHHLLSTATKAKGSFRGKAWKEYYTFKNKHLLLENIMSGNKLIVKKDIDYGYAITTHKSQGSTFTNVAISENNIDRNEGHQQRNKLKYVAFSRPTKRAIVFSNKAK